MERKTRFIGLLLSVLLILTVQSAFAQEVQSSYFPETGHYVTGEFYAFYYSNPNARLAYGNPITEAVIDPVSDRLVQYFENVRFEYHAENLPGDKVRLTPLGQLLYEHGTYLNELNVSTPGCHRAESWDYSVCFSFYDFYQANGGETHFGKPVSGLEYLRGRLVQFFEYAQLVWMPENPASAQIVVAQLGLKYFFVHETNFSKLDPIRNLEYTLNISEVSIDAFPRSAVLSEGEAQVVNFIAKDQNGAPLTNGIIHVTLRYPDGKETEITQLATDEFGLASFAFIANSSKLGPVDIIVRVTFNDLEAVTVTSFRLWY